MDFPQPLQIQRSNFALLEQMNASAHEMVLFCHDEATGLKAIVGVHNTLLGPSMGGVRMYPYASEAEALEDVLRLSKAMTYKSSLAGIHVGGGKAVIIGVPSMDKSEALLRRFGMFVNSLGGKFYVAADVGIKPSDLEVIKLETSFVSGVSPLLGGSGDSAPLTAYGGYLGMKAAIQHTEGHNSLEGKRIMVQGVGKVGSKLVKYLLEEGAEVYISDVNKEQESKLVKLYGIKAVKEEQVLNMDVDILSPNAMGGILNQESIPFLNCKIILGGANNQLLEEEVDARRVQEKGILFVPDFMVNAGGIINVSLELQSYHEDIAKRMTEKIYDTTLRVLSKADKDGVVPLEAAKREAEKRLEEVGKIGLYR